MKLDDNPRELDCKKKIKRIIAREGLILLGFVGVGFLLQFSNKPDLSNIGIFLFLLGYPAYLLVRFIIWAIKTLKSKVSGDI